MRWLPLLALVACGGSVASSDDAGADASDANAPKKDGAAPKDASLEAAVDTVPLDGRTVVSPNGTDLAQVEVCVFQRPELGCVTSGPDGSFTIGLPSNSETGVTLTRAGYASVLVPLVVGSSPLKYTMGVPTAQGRTSLFAAFGAKYPDPAHGFVMLVGTLKGQSELDLDGASATIDATSGTGPHYMDVNGNPDPAATSTSSYSMLFFANVDPGTYVAKLTPVTMSCFQNFGGWTTAQLNATRFPVAAGFETHVGLACAKP